MSLFKKYARTVRKHTNYRATWLPGSRLELGQVGIISDGVFHYRTDLEKLGIAFEVRRDNQPNDTFNFDSNGVRSTSFKAAGETDEAFKSVAAAKAGARVEFSGAHAVVMRTKNARVNTIADIAKLETDLLAAVQRTIGPDGEAVPPVWQRDWVVITEVVDAEAATIIMSTERDATIEIEASGTIGPDGLVDVDAGFGHESTQSIGIKEIAKRGMTPLHRAIRVRRQFLWWWDDVVPADGQPPQAGDDLFEDDMSDIEGDDEE